VLEGYEGDGGDVVPHLVDGQDATADHLRLGGDEGGHDQTRAVAETQARLHKQGLHANTHTQQRSRVNQHNRQS